MAHFVVVLYFLRHIICDFITKTTNKMVKNDQNRGK